MSNYQTTGEVITFYSKNNSVNVRIIDENIINIRSPLVKDTPATENLIPKKVEFNIGEDEKNFYIQTSSLTVKIDKELLLVTFIDEEGIEINQDHQKNIDKENSSYCYKELKSDETFMGLGEKTGFLNKKGERFRFWNYANPNFFTPISDNMYISIPFLLSKSDRHVYGLFFDNTSDSFIDLGSESNDYYYFGAEDGHLNYYFIYGKNIKQVIEGYTNITGRTPMPPLWSMGYHQSRWSYFPDEKVVEMAKLFREKEIPCDSIHLDIDYMDNYKIFTFNEKFFPKPEEFFKTMDDLGFKMITIIDPGVKKENGYKVYEEGVKKDHFLKDKNGEVYTGDVWPGGCAFPDFTKESVRNWWADLNVGLLEKGVKGIWNDLNEPSILSQPHHLPKNILHETDNGIKPHSEIHNVYANYEAKATEAAWNKYDQNTRPFILSRSGFAGIQRYAAVWTGDNTSSWDQLLLTIPMIMNLGLSGIPFAGVDVGGYAGNVSEELLIRWIQLGAFVPLFRNHSRKETRDQEPWAFGKEAEEIMKRYIKLRYRLLPYIYNLFRISFEKGYPVFRPMFFDHEDDENTYMNDQFMLGDSILVAPIYLPNQKVRSIYLPKGIWYDFWTGERYEGGKHIVKKTTIKDIPVFIKSGSIIPMYPDMNYVGEKSIEQITFEVYQGNGSYIFYEDDGNTKDYQRNMYNKTIINVEGNENEFFVQLEPLQKNYHSSVKNYRFLLRGFSGFKNVNCSSPLKVDVVGDRIEFIVPNTENINLKFYFEK